MTEPAPHLRPARRRPAASDAAPPDPTPGSEELRELLEAAVDHLIALRSEVAELRAAVAELAAPAKRAPAKKAATAKKAAAPARTRRRPTATSSD